MAVINYNSTNIKKIILPSLSTSIVSLKNSYNIFSQLSIPQDFKYKNQLKSLNQELKFKLDKLSDIYNKIEASSNMFNSSEIQFQNGINNISNPKISLRRSIIS